MQILELKADFTERIKENSGILHKVCNVYCITQEEKLDMMQEITLQLWKAFPGFQGKAKFSSWMYRVAVNTVISNIRRKQNIPIVESFTSQHEIETAKEDIPDTEDSLNRLYKAIAVLNDIEKAIIMLYLEENSYSEIADIVGITEKNVSVRIVRIKKKLQKLMERTAT